MWTEQQGFRLAQPSLCRPFSSRRIRLGEMAPTVVCLAFATVRYKLLSVTLMEIFDAETRGDVLM